jgi:dTMP kinase
VVESREPGGTDLGLELRELVLHRRGHIAPRAEALIYAADRAHNIATKVRPALEAGDIVVQDRYLDSSIAYQGAGRVLDADEVRFISTWATEGLLPDLTILLDLDPEVGRARIAGGAYDRLEEELHDFHARVRDAYLALAAAEPDRFLVLDATLSVAELESAVRERVSVLLA